MSYRFAYRVGMRPWEAYRLAAAAHIADQLDRSLADRSRAPGRALDLGCGRGEYAADLVDRGWEVVGVDNVPQAISEAQGRRIPGATFVLADVRHLASAGLGEFDFFLDIGCLQGLSAPGRESFGRGVTSMARPGATMLLLQFQPTWLQPLAGGVSRTDVETALPDWDLRDVQAAQTAGLGWPLTRTKPLWYRFSRRAG